MITRRVRQSRPGSRAANQAPGRCLDPCLKRTRTEPHEPSSDRAHMARKRLICRLFTVVGRMKANASHARGRWFETTRAHTLLSRSRSAIAPLSPYRVRHPARASAPLLGQSLGQSSGPRPAMRARRRTASASRSGAGCFLSCRSARSTTRLDCRRCAVAITRSGPRSESFPVASRSWSSVIRSPTRDRSVSWRRSEP